MKNNLNSVALIGNLVKDIEIRETASGTSVGNFTLANNQGLKNSTTGEYEEYVNYFDCVLFGERATKLTEYLKKGIYVCVRGELRFSSWEKDGKKSSKVQVIVRDIELLTPKKSEAAEDNAASESCDFLEGDFF